MAGRDSDEITLTGILGTTDSYDRLRLCLVDVLPSRENDRKAGADQSWAVLRRAVPASDDYAVPYDFPLGGAPDDAGIRGECWVTVPGGRGKAAQGRRQRILNLAAELRGKEVTLTVRPKRYSFTSGASHNAGADVAGTSLLLVTIESLL